MRLMVMAAERAETMATTIQRIWRKEGQPCDVKRAASSAPVSAKGRAKMECSNLIISRTVRMRPAMAPSGLRFLRFGMRTGPAVHPILSETNLSKHAANVLRYEIVDCFRLVIERRNRRHDERAGSLRPHHIFKMNAAEGRVSDTEDELSSFFEHDVSGARDQVVARAAGDGRQTAHRAGNDEHGVNFIAAGCNGGANVFIRQGFDFRVGFSQQTRRELLEVTAGNSEFLGEKALAGFRDDKMNVCHPRVFGEQMQSFLREQRAAGAGHTQSYDLSLGLVHCSNAEKSSFAAGERQVKKVAAERR